MDSAASDSQINLALLLFLIFPCHHFLTLVWVRHQFLHLTLRQDENSRELKMASYRIICPSWDES
ncbi:hypothetical protein EJB05_11184 [Eragrostis curvula]|uniref:Uncharacterized protein n=1 Tax=Eragrostis curvula TaxID=38414 RepID=A0A5J9VNU3_9POAL|nr:hypothetical protein EJB05_11184 [Eragrostis curvula]